MQQGPPMQTQLDKKEYLNSIQYKDASNLSGRISIHERYSERPKSEFWKWLLQNHQLNSGDELLEVGCGRGDFWIENSAAIPSDLKVTLTDISQGMLDTAKRHLSIPGAECVLADVESLPFEDHTFDKVIAHMMLYHTIDKNKALAELKRVAKVHAHIGISTTGDGHMTKILELAKHINSNLDWAESGSASFSESLSDKYIAKHFQDFEKRVWCDRLLVTSADAVVDYFKTSSASHLSQQSQSFYEEMGERVRKEIETRGAFDVPKRIVFYSCKT